MVVARAAARFLFQVAVGLILTTVVAAIWALAGGSGFAHAFHVSLYVFGGLALMMGAFGVGGVSPSQGFVGGDRFSGRIPGLKASAYTPPDGTAVNANAILLVTGATLIGVAIAV
jgi:hypothetical protein